jgi:hypothetical protein
MSRPLASLWLGFVLFYRANCHSDTVWHTPDSCPSLSNLTTDSPPLPPHQGYMP